MPRDRHINIHYECDMTEWEVNIPHVITWCTHHVQGAWNLVADSGASAARGTGEHKLIFLCDDLRDMTKFKLCWQP
jgi:hypothetical protein